MLYMPNDLSRLTRQLQELTEDLKASRERTDAVYRERDMCVSLIAQMAHKLGYKVGLGAHVGDNWDDEWRNIVFVDLPSGQVSWHIHDSEKYMFDWMPPYDGKWDGHSTELKYSRVLSDLSEG